MKLRKEVKWFAEKIEEVLKENDYKCGWKDCSNIKLLDFLEHEVKEAKQALINGDKEDILKECCDVANYAMMIADNNK